MIFFEKIHTIADMFLSILLPLSLLVFMTAMIVWRLWIWPRRRWRSLQKGKTQQNGNCPAAATGLLSTAAYQERNKRENHFAAEKRGVTRITLITCFIQAILQMNIKQWFEIDFSWSLKLLQCLCSFMFQCSGQMFIKKNTFAPGKQSPISFAFAMPPFPFLSTLHSATDSEKQW